VAKGETYSTGNIKKHPVLQGAKQNRNNETGMWERRGFWWGNPKDGDHFKT
jgi:hypothetical protein